MSTWTANDGTLSPYNSELVAYWDMEETGTNDRVDKVHSLPLAVTGSVTNSASAKHGTNCVQLHAYTSSADAYLKTTTMTNIQPNGASAYAISGWYYKEYLSTSTSGVNNFAVLTFLDTTLRAYIRNYTPGDGRTGELKETDDDVLNVNEGSTYEPGSAWHHYVVIADDTAGKLYLYWDNVSIGTPESWDGTFKTASKVLMGCQDASNDLFWTDMRLDEVAFWRNISFANDTEREDFVDALYNSGTGAFYEDENSSSTSTQSESSSNTSSVNSTTSYSTESSSATSTTETSVSESTSSDNSETSASSLSSSTSESTTSDTSTSETSYSSNSSTFSSTSISTTSNSSEDTTSETSESTTSESTTSLTSSSSEVTSESTTSESSSESSHSESFIYAWDVINRVRKLINDPNSLRYTDANLLYWLNDAIRIVRKIRYESQLDSNGNLCKFVEVTSTSDEIPLSENWESYLTDYVCYRAFSEMAEDKSNIYLAPLYEQLYLEELFQ